MKRLPTSLGSNRLVTKTTTLLVHLINCECIIFEFISSPLDDHKQQTKKHEYTHKKTDYDILDLFDYFLDTSSHSEFYNEEDDTT